MVLNKRLMYLLILVLNMNQLFCMLFGIVYAICSLLEAEEVITMTFFMLHYEGVIASLGLTIFCKTMSTRVLYMIFFNKEQSWVREGQLKWRRRFVKMIGIIVTIFGITTLLIVMPTVCITATAYYYPGVNQEMAREAAVDRFLSDALVGLLYIIVMTFIGIVNGVLVLALVRKMMSQNSPLASTAAIAQRQAACRRVLLLSAGQFFLGLAMVISALILVFALFNRYLIIVSSFLQTFNIVVFSLVVVFSFGPLDFIVAEGLRKVSHRRLEKLNSKATITRTTCSSDVATSIRNDIKGDEELQRRPSDFCDVKLSRTSSVTARQGSLSSSRNSNKDLRVVVTMSPFSPGVVSESGEGVPELSFPPTTPSEFLESSIV
nr:unnamed protein product [Naegleria fowleri]